MVSDNMRKIEPYMMTVLCKRLESIAREMTNTTLKSARSGIMNMARDFSCSILTGDGKILFTSEGLPMHMANTDLAVQYILETFGADIHEGDNFLHNSPYHGATHHADLTHITPVFVEGELLFFVINRGHQADIGNHLPTTYYVEPRDIYEEGAMNWPGVRVQRNYQDIEDIIRMAKMRIRVPEQWYGDYLAQLGSCRVAEKRLQELCAAYGKDYIKAFVDAYMEYSETLMVSVIKQLPKAHLEYSTTHDPYPGMQDEEVRAHGIPLHMSVDIDPDEGYIHVDVSNNRPSVKGGLNMSKATTLAGVTTGIIGAIAPELPTNDGVFKRFKIKMGKNQVVGESDHPVSMSVSTTNVAERVVSMSGAILEGLGEQMGIAEHGYAGSYANAVIAGKDPRKNDAPYVNQLSNGAPGGGALYGYDGWLTLGSASGGGLMQIDSIEMSELKYPILIKSRAILKDSQGFGRWCGAPGKKVELLQRFNEGSWIGRSDGHYFPAKGIHGGCSGKPAHMYKRSVNDVSAMWEGEEDVDSTILPHMNGPVMLHPETEIIISEGNGGGGYGNPLERDPQQVLRDVREEWISLGTARNIFGVVLNTESEVYKVDVEATRVWRDQLRAAASV